MKRILARLSILTVSAAVLAALFVVPAASAATTGWAGESIVGAGNTWEPYVAADPGSPYVYVMYNDFSATKHATHVRPSR